MRVFGITHEGLVSDKVDPSGKPYVISKSRRSGRVAEESWDTFANGRKPFVVGYPGRRNPEEVISAARARMGEKWGLNSNCQHFVRECHGIESFSPEIRLYGFMISISGASVIANLLRALR